jgi:hypothetical protein
MSVEARRGCGYRKVNGLYLVSGGQGMPCCKLVIKLTICPTCGGGIKQTRGWTWIDPRPWLQSECTGREKVLSCPAADPSKLGKRVGLLWVGHRFYPTADHFKHEAMTLGISRRIAAVPRGFEIGNWIFLAHPKAIENGPGIFYLFRPERIEKIVTESMAKDEEAMADLRKRGITPVIVPDDDRDHQGSIWEDEDQPAPTLEFTRHESHQSAS